MADENIPQLVVGVDVRVVEGYTVEVAFEDGAVKHVDLGQHL